MAAQARGRPGRVFAIFSRPAGCDASAAVAPRAEVSRDVRDRSASVARLSEATSRLAGEPRGQRGDLACAIYAIADAVEHVCRLLEGEDLD